MGIFEKLTKYKEEGYLSAHMPGHKSGRLLPEDLERVFGKEVFEFDITEIDGMDNLQNPQGIIKETEDKIAGLCEAEEAFLLVNGSTTGLLASIFTLARNKEIFVGGNSHQAVYNAMMIAGSSPIFLAPELEIETGTELGVSPETLLEAIKRYPDCKVIILTFPNYYGLRYKYKEIIKIAKKNHLKIIIDEAHGAHFNFMGKNYPNGIILGADAVIQSWHKTLPVLNQGSILLTGKNNKEYDFRSSINLFQTTSPSYLIMSTIDVAADFLIKKEKRLIDSGTKWQEFFSGNILKNLKIFRGIEEYADPFKLLIYSKRKAGNLFKKIIIKKHKIQPEIIEEERLLFMLPLFFDLELGERLKKALQDLDNQLNGQMLLTKEEEPVQEKIIHMENTPQELSFRNKKKVAVLESVGRICAQKIVKYPPGVPFVYPGQLLKEEIVCYLNRHKINYNLQEGIEIFTDQEN